MFLKEVLEKLSVSDSQKDFFFFSCFGTNLVFMCVVVFCDVTITT